MTVGGARAYRDASCQHIRSLICMRPCTSDTMVESLLHTTGMPSGAHEARGAPPNTRVSTTHARTTPAYVARAPRPSPVRAPLEPPASPHPASPASARKSGSPASAQTMRAPIQRPIKRSALAASSLPPTASCVTTHGAGDGGEAGDALSVGRRRGWRARSDGRVSRSTPCAC
jgi:hypothetical protein